MPFVIAAADSIFKPSISQLHSGNSLSDNTLAQKNSVAQQEAASDIDCPQIADIVLAILLFADDIAPFSYSAAGLQKQLDILSKFCAACGLSVNVKKTKIVVFELRKSITSCFYFNGDTIEQVDKFKYLGVLMHGTKGLSPAIEYLCKAAKRAMSGLQRRCQQLSIHDPILKRKLFDTLVKPFLCYCCEVWSVLGSKTALEGVERDQVRFLKALLGVQVHTKTLHVLAEFRRYPQHVTVADCEIPFAARISLAR